MATKFLRCFTVARLFWGTAPARRVFGAPRIAAHALHSLKNDLRPRNAKRIGPPPSERLVSVIRRMATVCQLATCETETAGCHGTRRREARIRADPDGSLNACRPSGSGTP